MALLVTPGQKVVYVYVPGRTANHPRPGPHAPGLRPAGHTPELVPDLRVLTNYQAGLISDRMRLINLLRDLLVGICPALKRAFSYSSAKDPVLMPTLSRGQGR